LDFRREYPGPCRAARTNTLLLLASLIVVLLLSVAGVARAQTAQKLVVDSQTSILNFPDTVDFTLKAHGFETSRAELNYSVTGYSVTSGLNAALDAPASNLDLKVTLDLSTGYIPPGAEVVYYWTLSSDTDGDVYTPEKTFIMQDDRHAWQSLADAQKRVSVSWYDGDQQFGEALLTEASQALDRLQHDIGVGLARPASIWIYASQDDLLGALPRSNPEWVGGKAFPELSVVMADIANDTNAGDEIKRIVPHELSHLLLYQATRNPYNQPPAWMDEGLAVHNQETQDPAEEEALRQAAQAGKLVPLKALSGSFSADEQAAVLDYGESRSTLDFILSDNRYGPDKFARTVAAFRKGVTYDEAMNEGLGVTVDEIDAQWRQSLPYNQPAASGSSPNAPATNPRTGPTLDLTTAGLLVALGACTALVLVAVVMVVIRLVKRTRQV
jgi:hypothetical protein